MEKTFVSMRVPLRGLRILIKSTDRSQKFEGDCMRTVKMNRVVAALIFGSALTVMGCQSPTASSEVATGAGVVPQFLDEAGVTRAVATIGPSKAATTQPSNNDVTGTVTFSLMADHLQFVADVDGLEPNTKHGFHIHEKGDLSDPDLKSAGGHFNPTHEVHGGPGSMHHHAGDLGNLVADDKGHAHLEGMVMHVSFSGDTSILGRSVIIHAKGDDEKSNPAGNSGARIAGGVIKAQ
jgi:superoxide dismutase, Cu-Zn family